MTFMFQVGVDNDDFLPLSQLAEARGFDRVSELVADVLHRLSEVARDFDVVDVLFLVSIGLTDKQIAARLGVTNRYVAARRQAAGIPANRRTR